ncbi:hypothetical protein BH11BAC7_BH11BAC7_17710 [soil metagenome]
MKIRFIQFLLILFVSGSVFLTSAKSDKTASIEIKIKDCRSQSFAYLNNLKVIKDGQLIKELHPEHNSTQIVNQLSIGTYLLEYTSIFNKTETLKVNVSEFQKYPVELCVNYLNHTTGLYNPVIDRLEDGEDYNIIIASSGCFHSTNDTLNIKRENGNYKAKMGLKTKSLTTENTEAIRNFEIELNNLGLQNGCTTETTYTIVYKEQKQTVTDGGCSWSGNYYLVQNLFGKK